MKINADEIVNVLKQEIKSFESRLDLSEVGEVLSVMDGIARVYGLENVMANEMVEFDDGTRGLAFNLEEGSVGVVIMGEYIQIREGFRVKRTGKILQVPVGEDLLGRIVDTMGEPIDGLGPVHSTTTRPVEILAPGIARRMPVGVPLQTGIKAIDAMIPIGRGQRELIIGDRGTGKTAIAIDAIINNRDTGVICVYVAIGQKSSKVAAIREKLERVGAMKNTIIVAANASDPAPMQYLAPYAGAAMAEYFMYEHGKDTLVVYDDLTKQANAYRQMSLLLRRPPGREAFPGDVFYLHSRLLERAARLNKNYGGGSMTALPIVETQEGEVSAYIPTNVISITDGQIYLLPNLFASGQRPAVDPGISVSRVGGAAQVKGIRKYSGRLRLDLAQFRALEAFAQLGTELDPATQAQLDRGYRVLEVLKQDESVPLPVEEQIVTIFGVTRGHMDVIPVSRIREFEAALLKHLNETHVDVMHSLREKKAVENEEKLDSVIKSFAAEFMKSSAGKAAHAAGS